MTQPPPDPSTRNLLLLEFPVRLYTALRTVRLYPATNPQVLRSIDLVERAFRDLLATTGADRGEIAVVEQQLLVCGEPLADRDQVRPQIVGLSHLFQRLQIHSLTFHPSLTAHDFTRFAELLATLPEGRQPAEPLPVLLDQAGLHGIVVDIRRYVALGEGEQVVREELATAMGVDIDDEELAQFVIGQTGAGVRLQAVDATAAPDPAARLTAAVSSSGSDEERTAATAAMLVHLAGSTDPDRRAEDLRLFARTLAGLDPSRLARLISRLPQTPLADELLGAVFEQLPPERLDRLAVRLATEQGPEGEQAGADGLAATATGLIDRIAAVASAGPDGRLPTFARSLDAVRLLLDPDEDTDGLPDGLRRRLVDPDWAAPVLTSAARQVTDPDLRDLARVDFAAFNRLLGRYEQLLDHERQQRVATLAGAELAAVEGATLSTLLAETFKGLFGDQVYRQVVSAMPDELLDRTLTHLTPRQLNRMIAALTSDLPPQPGPAGEPPPDGDPVLRRLAQTRRGPEVSVLIARNQDAGRLLRDPEPGTAGLAEPLRQRLGDPQWAGPVLASATLQVADPPAGPHPPPRFTALQHLFARCEQLLDRDQQERTAQLAGAELAGQEGQVLGRVLARRFRGLFGEQVYRQVVDLVADELLDQTVDHLTPKQLNRMVAALTSDMPLEVSRTRDQEFAPADDTLLKRLSRTRKGVDVTRMIAQNLDAHALQAGTEVLPRLPERLAMRLQQPAWAAPVLVSAAEQTVDPANFHDGKADPARFVRLLDRYDTLLSKDKQVQVAARAGAALAGLDDSELALLLVRADKSGFGEQLNEQVIGQLGEERIGRIARRLKAAAEGSRPLPVAADEQQVASAYQQLVQTARGEKMRAMLELHRERQRRREEEERGRITSLLDELHQGRFTLLEQKDCVPTLAAAVRDLLGEGREAEADGLLMQLAVALQHQRGPVRSHAAHGLAAIAEQLAASGQWQRLTRLRPALEQVLRLPGLDPQARAQILQALAALTGHHLASEQYNRAHELVQWFQSLAAPSADPDRDDPELRALARDLLKRIGAPPVLDQLLKTALHSDTHREEASRVLTALGAPAAQMLLQHLMSDDRRYARRRLLDLLRQTGEPATAILLEQLHRDAPWYVIRNIVRLLGEVGGPEHFAAVRPFLTHPDLRVQREVISTGLRIGGEETRDFLLEALQTVPDELKTKVVHHAAEVHDERFVRPLTDLLESPRPFLGKNRDDLQLAICRTLGAIGSKRAAAALGRVAQSRTVLGLGGYSETVRQAAARALAEIRDAGGEEPVREVAELRSDRGAPSAGEGTGAAPAGTGAAASGTEEEEAIFALVAAGQPEMAKQRLIDLIAATARAGDFRTAERLRDRIYEIDGLALTEIIRAGEIIEQEKRGAIRDEDLEIWAALTDTLSSEEFQTIYHEFIERSYKPEETIVSQGDSNEELFFINRGSVKVSHLVGSRELFITSLSRGQIAGENFFTPSFWTVSLTSLTPVTVYVLPQSALTAWQERFPGLRTKLHQFYAASNNINAMLDRKGLERRRDQRFTLARRIQVQPVNTQNAPIGRGFRAETADLSLGGLAFLVRIGRQENARLLLGRRMQVVLPVGGAVEYLYLRGLVISVQPFHILQNDFSVHFRFDQPLDEQDLRTILG